MSNDKLVLEGELTFVVDYDGGGFCIDGKDIYFAVRDVFPVEKETIEPPDYIYHYCNVRLTIERLEDAK